MAKIYEELVAVKFSKLVKDDNVEVILDDDMKLVLGAMIDNFLAEAGIVGVIAEVVDLG